MHASGRQGISLVGRAFALGLFACLALAPTSALATSTGSISGTTLTVSGSGNADSIIVSRLGGSYQFYDTNTTITAGSGCSQSSLIAIACPTAGITTINVTASNGNDIVSSLINDALTPRINYDLGDGNDQLTSVNTTAAVNGGSGNDTITTGSGSDLITPGTGTDTVNAGANLDVVVYLERTAPVSVSFDDQANDGEDGENDQLLGFETAVTGEGNDTLLGGDGNDLLVSCGGDDYLDGGAGNDTLDDANPFACPGGGNNLFAGDAGADAIIGGPGFDTVDYSSRNGPVSVTLDDQANDGEPGEGDKIYSTVTGLAVESVIGGFGNDTMIGDSGANVFSGGDGDDSLNGNGGDDSLYGDAGADTLNGGDDSDSIEGGDGGDMVNAGAGDDSMWLADGTQDVATCADGSDYVEADAFDITKGDCEAVVLPGGLAAGACPTLGELPATVKLTSRTTVSVELYYPGGAGNSCTGSVTLATASKVRLSTKSKAKQKSKKKAKKKKAKPPVQLKLGRANFSLAATESKQIDFSISAATAKKLAALKRVPVTVEAVGTDQVGNTTRATAQTTLKGKAKPKPKKKRSKTRAKR